MSSHQPNPGEGSSSSSTNPPLPVFLSAGGNRVLLPGVIRAPIQGAIATPHTPQAGSSSTDANPGPGTTSTADADAQEPLVQEDGEDDQRGTAATRTMIKFTVFNYGIDRYFFSNNRILGATFKSDLFAFVADICRLLLWIGRVCGIYALITVAEVGIRLLWTWVFLPVLSWIQRKVSSLLNVEAENLDATGEHYRRHYCRRNELMRSRWIVVAGIPVLLGIFLVLPHAIPFESLHLHPINSLRSLFYNRNNDNGYSTSSNSSFKGHLARDDKEGPIGGPGTSRWSFSFPSIPTYIKWKNDRQLLAALVQDSTQSAKGLLSSPELWIALERLVQKVSLVELSIEEVKYNIESIQQQLRAGRWMEDKVLGPIRYAIPDFVVLGVDHVTKRVEVPVEFWEGVLDLLVTRGSVAESVRDNLYQRPHRRTGSGERTTAGGGGVDGREEGEYGDGWFRFLTENEDRMDRLDRKNKKSLRGTSRMKIVERNEFLDLIAKESNAIWVSLQHKMIQSLGDNFAATSIQGLSKEELNRWRWADASEYRHTLSRVEQHVLAELIDGALDKQLPNHGIHQIDFALSNSGGRIIDAFTETTLHDIQPMRILGGILTVDRLVPLGSPIKAIQTHMNPGDCWPIMGSSGQIAIQLARKIVVTAVTIEHIDPRISLDLGSAPRKLEIWRLEAVPPSVDWVEDAVRASHDDYDDDDGGGVKKEKGGRGEHVFSTKQEDSSSVFKTSLLATVEYQHRHGEGPKASRHPHPNSGSGRVANDNNDGGIGGDGDEGDGLRMDPSQLAQTFVIPLSKQVASSTGVMIKILSNWGHPEFTCLYRVRVHGYEI